MSASAGLSRRSFLAVIGAGSASFALGSFSDFGTKSNASLEPNAFVKLDPDGLVTITVSKSEMGQGVRTSLAMIVAEQMDCDWTKVRVLQATGNREKYGPQQTWGSQSTRSMYQRLCEMGAAARMMLVDAAAKEWGVEPAMCKTENGKVLHTASGRSMDFGDLASAAAEMPVPSGTVKLKERSAYRIVGKDQHRVDNRDVATGKAIFAQDVQVPGALVGVISRRPAFGATLKGFDDTETRKVPGVVDVFKVSTGVCVVAENTWAAIKGREALKPDWDLGPNATLNSAEITKRMRGAVGQHPEMPAGAKVVEATYDFPYLAHYTMEPMNAIADVRADSCTVWAPSQAPDGVHTQVARMLNLPPASVTINVPLLGGGFGRRSNADFVNDAVEASQGAKRPVKLLWTREDDMRNDYYRPTSHHALRGAVMDGKPVGFNHQFIKAGGGSSRTASQPRNAQLDYSFAGATQMNGSAASPVPTGAWRSVDHSQVSPAIECFIDEMAHAAGKDPVAFRRENISDERLLKIIDLCIEKSGWNNPLPAGRYRGFACFNDYGGRAAHAVEIGIVDGAIKVYRAVCCVDTGFSINPNGVKQQMEGACMDAIATTLFAEITIENGGVVQGTPYEYEWARLMHAPAIEVHIIEGGTEPCGMGEIGYPAVPAAIANAVFAATGKRVRKFPIKLDELV